MTTGTTIAIIGGLAVFAIVAYLIVKNVDSTSQFGDLIGGAEALL